MTFKYYNINNLEMSLNIKNNGEKKIEFIKIFLNFVNLFQKSYHIRCDSFNVKICKYIS